MDDFIINRISELLTDGDYTQKELANHLGLSDSQLSNAMNGKRKLSIDELVGIAKFLNVKVEYILGLSSDKDEETQRTRLFLELFTRMTDTEEFKNGKRDIITPADMEFSKAEGKFTVLIGSSRLFTLIDKVAELNSRHKQGTLPDDEFDSLVKRAWNKFSVSKVENKVGRFLISPKQFEDEEERVGQLTKLLDHLSTEET